MAHIVFTSSALRRSLTVLMFSCLATAAMASDTEVSDQDFPSLESSYLKTGDFIGPDHVRRIMPGLGKDQVRLELGNPHFSEGIFGVRVWDYAFNFYTGKGSDYVTCQFKVKFDNDYRVASTHWKGADCASYVNPPVVPVASVAPVASAAPARAVATVTVSLPASTVQPARRRVVLAADGLFAFGKSGIDDLARSGLERLEELAGQLKQDLATLKSVTVTGHTDRIGSDASNLALSRARADTVRNYLVRAGVDAALIQARGMGESKPVVECAGTLVTPKLVACLQPNRRVEIESVGEK